MYCKQCGSPVLEQAAVCVKCGVAIEGAKLATPGARSKTSYILLGALLGLVGLPGIHNLYAGYTNKGLVQLLVSIFTCWILWLPMYVWTIVEICTVTVDSEGNPLQ